MKYSAIYTFLFSGVSMSLLSSPSNHFYGCMGDIHFYSDSEDLQVPLHDKAGVELGCMNQCEVGNQCVHGGQCINHYTHTTCDCFGTRYEGQFCEKQGKY